MSTLEATAQPDPHLGERPTRRLWNRARTLARELVADLRADPPGMAPPALAYYATIALAPLLLLLIHALSHVYGTAAARDQIVNELSVYAGQATAEVVRGVLERAARSRAGGLASTLASLILLAAASRVFIVLQEAVNHVWRLPARRSGFSRNLRKRLLSFVLVLGMGALLISSMVMSMALGAVERYFAHALPTIQIVKALNLLVFFALVTFVWATMYKVLPDAPVEWGDVWLGAFAASILFAAGRGLLALYFSWSTLGSAYAAAGSLVVVLLWLHYSSHVALLGARITRLWAEKWGSRSGGDQQAGLARHGGQSNASS